MSVDAIVTLAVLAVVVVALARELVSPVTGIMGALVVLLLAGVVDAQRAFAGFSNPATITVAALLVVARAVQDTGGIDMLLGRVLDQHGSDRAILARLVPSVSAASAIIANTPIVAMLAPPLRSWAERRHRAPSRFLMPLSFAAILGGLGTTIGTSVTLLVSGLVAEAGLGGFGILEITPLGLPLAAVGGALLVVLAPRVLPDRRSPYAQVATHERDYSFGLRVEPGGVLDGLDVRAAGLRRLEGVYLARIQRGDREIAPVPPDELLVGGDLLTFVGRVDHVRDLQARDGLKSAEEQHIALVDGRDHGLVEVVLGAESPVVGRTPKEVSFRGRYGAAIVAIHRAGQRVEAKLGEVRLEPGDALLLFADGAFAGRWRDRRDFLLVVPLDPPDHRRDRRAWLPLTVLVAMVAAAAAGLPLLEATLGAVLVLVVARAVSISRARQALDLDLLLVIAGAIGIGGAVEASGLADTTAEAIAAVAGPFGGLGALATLLVGTLVLTELVTNAAAAASSSFLTPIGYQTNTMVYGLGGYRFTDYWRLGLPLTLAVIATTLLVMPLFWRL